MNTQQCNGWEESMKKKEGKEEKERQAAHEVANYRKRDEERKATKAWMDGMQRSHGKGDRNASIGGRRRGDRNRESDQQ
jgi:hypothetical protein